MEVGPTFFNNISVKAKHTKTPRKTPSKVNKKNIVIFFWLKCLEMRTKRKHLIYKYFLMNFTTLLTRKFSI